MLFVIVVYDGIDLLPVNFFVRELRWGGELPF